MILTEEATVADAALPIEAFKAHLRLGTGFTGETVQDDVLKSFLRAALAAVEARTGKVLFERGFRWTLTAWRDLAGQVLPVAPVMAINRVLLLDRLGGEAELAPTLYWLDGDSERPRLRPTGANLPTIPLRGEVVIEFTAGMSPDWGGLPADLAHAVLLLAAHYYEYRNETALGDGCMPFGVTSLLQRYRPIRLGIGGA